MEAKALSESHDASENGGSSTSQPDPSTTAEYSLRSGWPCHV